MIDRDAPDAEHEANVLSTERSKRHGSQVVRVVIASSSGNIVQVEVPVGSLNLPNLHEDNWYICSST